MSRSIQMKAMSHRCLNTGLCMFYKSWYPQIMPAISDSCGLLFFFLYPQTVLSVFISKKFRIYGLKQNKQSIWLTEWPKICIVYIFLRQARNKCMYFIICTHYSPRSLTVRYTSVWCIIMKDSLLVVSKYYYLIRTGLYFYETALASAHLTWWWIQMFSDLQCFNIIFQLYKDAKAIHIQ